MTQLMEKHYMKDPFAPKNSIDNKVIRAKNAVVDADNFDASVANQSHSLGNTPISTVGKGLTTGNKFVNIGQ